MRIPIWRSGDECVRACCAFRRLTKWTRPLHLRADPICPAPKPSVGLLAQTSSGSFVRPRRGAVVRKHTDGVRVSACEPSSQIRSEKQVVQLHSPCPSSGFPAAWP